MTPAMLFLVAAFAAALHDAASVPPTPVVFVDAGHGGDDHGAVVGQKREKDIALAVARKLRDRLAGELDVRLTRDADVYVPLDERIAATQVPGAAVFVSLHIDQTRQRSAEGIRVYAFGRDEFPAPKPKRRLGLPPLPAPPRETARAGAALASQIVRGLRARRLPVDPSSRATFYVLKNPTVPSVLVELGYLTNPRERERLADPAYQDRLAEALADSVSAHVLGGAVASAQSGR